MKHLYLLLSCIIFFPDAIGQWQQTKGPYIGRTTSMITVGNNIYACNRDWGNSDGRIYRSSNFGSEWVAADNGITPQFASVSQFANVGETILAAANRLYRTQNQGGNWEIKEAGLFAQAISLMSTTDTFWAGTSGGGVFRSINLGDTWIPMNNGLTGTVIVYDMIDLMGYLFLATEGGGGPARLYRSSNRGLSWEVANAGLPLGSNPHYFAANGSRLFVSMEGDFAQYEYGLYKSDDFGNSWTPCNNGLPQIINGNTGEIFVHNGAIYVSTTFPGDNIRVFKSTDNGASFFPSSAGLRNANQVYTYTAAGGYIFSGSGWYSSVFRSANEGATWEESRKGLANGEVRSLMDHNGRLYAGTREGLFFTTDMGENWTELLNGLPYGLPIQTMEKNGSNIYLGTEQYGVFRSTDNGGSWQQKNTGLDGLYAEYVNDLLFYNGALYAATWDGVYKSTNNGDSWTASNTGLPGAFGSIVEINTIIESGGVLFAGTTLERIYKSTDNGATWTPSGNGLDTYASTVNNLLKVGATLFAATESGVYRSTDNGTNWTITMLYGGPFKVITHGGGVLYASQFGPTVLTGYGVFRSLDNGITWETMNDGMHPGSRLLSLLVYNGVLFGGTDTRSVWGRPAAVIPVGLMSFTGRKVSLGNELRWTTSTEQHNRGFEIERSIDGITFNSIGFENSRAVNGSSSAELAYKFLDQESLVGNVWYRLKQVDLDGRSTLSNTVLIRDKSALAIDRIYPNPASDHIQVEIFSAAGENAVMSLIDAGGRSMRSNSLYIRSGQHNYRVPLTGLPPGAYALRISNDSRLLDTKFFLKKEQ